MLHPSYLLIFRKFEIFNRKEGRGDGGEKERKWEEVERVSFLLNIVVDRTFKKI